MTRTAVDATLRLREIQLRGGPGSGPQGGKHDQPKGGVHADGIHYTKDPAAPARYSLVKVDTAKLDAAWSKDKEAYIHPGGKGEIAGRREQFQQHLASGASVHAPQVHVDPKSGKVGFENGRHRFSVIRDAGKSTTVISVARSQVQATKDHYGA